MYNYFTLIGCKYQELYEFKQNILRGGVIETIAH